MTILKGLITVLLVWFVVTGALLYTARLDAAVEPSPVDAFAIWGQSNAAGFSTQTTAAVTSPDSETGLTSYVFRTEIVGRVWSWLNDWPCSQLAGDTECGASIRARTPSSPACPATVAGVDINVADDPLPYCRTSQWPSFAREWMRDRNRQVFVVSSAVGSTCLVLADSANEPAWLPSVDIGTMEDHDAWTGTTAGNPGDLLARAILGIEVAGVSGSLRAVFWDQGECDMHASVSGAAYEAALEALADVVWQRFRVPLIVSPASAELGDYVNEDLGIDADDCDPPGVDAEYLAIRAAQEAAIADHPHIYMGPDKDNLEIEGANDDCSHVHDVETLGQLWFAAAEAAGL